MRFKDNSRLRTRSQARLESRYWILVRIRVRGPPPRAGTSARTRDRDQPGSFLASRAARSCFKCLPMSSDPVPAFIFLTQTRALPPGPGRRTAAARACQHHESYAPAGARPGGRPVSGHRLTVTAVTAAAVTDSLIQILFSPGGSVPSSRSSCQSHDVSSPTYPESLALRTRDSEA